MNVYITMMIFLNQEIIQIIYMLFNFIICLYMLWSHSDFCFELLIILVILQSLFKEFFTFVLFVQFLKNPSIYFVPNHIQSMV